MSHQEECSDCNHSVSENDPYFATPCGTFCSDCMETKHSKECGVCASEFDLKAKHCEGCGGTGIRLNQHGVIERCDTCDQYESDWHAWMAACPTKAEPVVEDA